MRIFGIGKKKNALETLLQLLKEIEKDEQKKLEKKISSLLKKHGIISTIKDIGNFTSSLIGTVTGGILSTVTGGLISGSPFSDMEDNLFSDNDKSKIEKKIKQLTTDATEQIKLRKDNAISSFPIPNSKEEISELIDYIYSNHSGHLKLKKDENPNKEAWKQKFHAIINFVKRNYSNDRIFLSGILEYEKQEKRHDMHENDNIQQLAMGLDSLNKLAAESPFRVLADINTLGAALENKIEF
jgi:hypothetical protein